MLNLPTLIDFSGSLATLCLLAAAYGGLYRILPDKRVFEPFMGALFGLVAFVQMHTPVEPVPGLIVDMRNIPLVLAGAYLGGRGLLVCLVVSAAARIEIGGVGASAALLSMLISGGVGLIWHGIGLRRRRSLLALGVLGSTASLNQFGVVLLPFDLALWFLTDVAPMLVAMQFVAIPIVAALLERERRQITREARLADAAEFTGGDSLMGQRALDWSLSQAAMTGSLSDGATVIGLRVRFGGALARFWGKDADRLAMKELYERLSAIMPVGGIVGWAEEDLIVMAIPQADAGQTRAMVTNIRRNVSAEPIAMPGMAPFRMVLDLDTKQYQILPALAQIVEDLRPVGLPKFAPPSTVAAGEIQAVQLKSRKQLDVARRAVSEGDLFSTFDRLHAARFDVG